MKSEFWTLSKREIPFGCFSFVPLYQSRSKLNFRECMNLKLVERIVNLFSLHCSDTYTFAFFGTFYGFGGECFASIWHITLFTRKSCNNCFPSGNAPPAVLEAGGFPTRVRHLIILKENTNVIWGTLNENLGLKLSARVVQSYYARRGEAIRAQLVRE